MKRIIPRTEWKVNHLRNNHPVTLESPFTTTGDMKVNNSKPALWAAVTALMNKHYGGENLNRLAREAKIGPATSSRMKAQETSVGIDTIDRLADYFRVEPWQLILPGFDPDRPSPLANASAMGRDIAAQLDALPDEASRLRAYALILQIIEFGAAPTAKKVEAPEPAPVESPTPTPLPHK